MQYQDQTSQKKNGKSVVQEIIIKKLKMLFENTSPASYHISVFFPYFVTSFPVYLLIVRPCTACSSPAFAFQVSSLPQPLMSMGCGGGCPHCPRTSSTGWRTLFTIEWVLCFQCHRLGPLVLLGECLEFFGLNSCPFSGSKGDVWTHPLLQLCH